MIVQATKLASMLEEGQAGNVTDPLVITPTPDLKVLKEKGAASVDLRLGTWFMNLRQARVSSLKIETTAKQGADLSKMHYVPFGQPFVLHPMTFVLAATLEWVRLPKTLAAYVVGKSSWGRYGLIIATATGVHPSFFGCITLELSNVGEIPIEIKPGYPICQLFFHTLDGDVDKDFPQGDFGGSRRPMFRPIRLDPFAERLANAQ
jgi:dCTP deaminase